MKKTIIFVISALLFFAFAFGAFAENGNRLCDFADLLTDSEEAEVKERLDRVSEKNLLDVVVVTTNDTEGKSSMAYADDFYDENGYGYGDNFDTDGVLLLVNMDERELWISTSGRGAEIVTDYGIEEIFDRITDYASKGDYKSAFIKFADTCDEFAGRYNEGDPFDIYYPSDDEDDGYYDPYGGYVEKEKEKFDIPKCAFISVAVGFIVSLITVSAMKGKLKSVASQYSAVGYAEHGGITLTEERDTFLYSNITKTPIPRDTSQRNGGHTGGHSGGSSMHMSSGGHSHGGGGRHF